MTDSEKITAALLYLKGQKRLPGGSRVWDGMKPLHGDRRFEADDRSIHSETTVWGPAEGRNVEGFFAGELVLLVDTADQVTLNRLRQVALEVAEQEQVAAPTGTDTSSLAEWFYNRIPDGNIRKRV